jgi:hypothetical protein
LKWRYAGKDESYVPLSSKSMFYHRLCPFEIENNIMRLSR